jgi:hypothetical protein
MLLSILDNIIQPWYDDDHYLIRKTMLETVTNGKFIVKDIVFILEEIMPSGMFGTADFQTLKNIILLRASFYYLTKDDKFDDFPKQVSVICFGDDHVVNPSQEVSHLYNQNSIPAVLKSRFGQGYTSDDKTDTNPPDLRDLSEVTFLKRSFRFDNHVQQYVAPLDLAVILEMPYWTKKGLMSEKITLDNVETAIRELAFHPDDIYAKWSIIMCDVVWKVFRIQLYIEPRRMAMERNMRRIEYY